MKIRAICVMKNESDVINQTLSDALRWCDEIFLLDNGSDDDGWDRVQSMSAVDPRIVLCGRDFRPFHDGMRAQIYNAHSKRAVRGDWWCRLDADEFYVDDPRELLAATPTEYFSVWSASLSYYFTDDDARRYEADPSKYEDGVPVGEKCRYYLNHWSEPRFFRHAPGRFWHPEDGGYPISVWARPASPTRIRLKHFAYRSPAQIQKRLDGRRAQAAAGVEFSHEMVVEWAKAVAGIREHGHFTGTVGDAVADSWIQRIVPASALDFDAHDGTFVVNDDLMPPIPAPWGASKRWMASLRSARRRLMGSLDHGG
jgi:glycosyltransferase involved in cell wall biosynthesis